MRTARGASANLIPRLKSGTPRNRAAMNREKARRAPEIPIRALGSSSEDVERARAKALDFPTRNRDYESDIAIRRPQRARLHGAASLPPAARCLEGLAVNGHRQLVQSPKPRFKRADPSILRRPPESRAFSARQNPVSAMRRGRAQSGFAHRARRSAVTWASPSS